MSNQVNLNKKNKKKKTLKDRFYEVVAIVTIGAVIFGVTSYINNFKEKRNEEATYQKAAKEKKDKEFNKMVEEAKKQPAAVEKDGEKVQQKADTYKNRERERKAEEASLNAWTPTEDSCETVKSESEMLDKGFENGDTSANAGRNYKEISNKLKQCKSAGFIK
ncbi:hypothetical protein CON64_22735 [Bacillus pseudomycoides]|nr:hypothetical protein CON64_22735 [Bacillus pseudomycoides]